MKRRDALGLLGGLSAAAFTPTAPAIAQSRSRKLVYMISFRGETDVEKGFKDYLRSTNLDLEIIQRDVNLNIANIKPFLEEIRSIKPDLIYTWGTPVTLAVVGPHDKPDQPIGDIPVVFALVATPVQSKIAISLERPGRNVTGSTHVVPTDVQMRAIGTYRPFQKIGIIYNPDELQSTLVRDEIAHFCHANDAELIERTFRKDNNGQLIAAELPDMVHDISAAHANWLYVPPDTYLGTQYPALVRSLQAEKLPSFGSVELAVRQGVALFGLVSRYYYVGQLAALKAVQILSDGRDPGIIPVESLKKFSLIVNIKLARDLGFYPPITLLNVAEIVEV